MMFPWVSPNSEWEIHCHISMRMILCALATVSNQLHHPHLKILTTSEEKKSRVILDHTGIQTLEMEDLSARLC